MTAKITIINPNSNRAVSAAMSEAVQPVRASSALQIDVLTLEQGPIGIESDDDVQFVIPHLRTMVHGDDQSDAFVIGCFSDPGIDACRDATDRPVFGIAECAALLASAGGGRFGVVALQPQSVARHLRYFESRGLLDRCAGDRPAGLTVAESESGADTLDKLRATGEQLRDLDGASTIILGCTGMARHQQALSDALGIPVIEPTCAAAKLAAARVT